MRIIVRIGQTLIKMMQKMQIAKPKIRYENSKWDAYERLIENLRSTGMTMDDFVLQG